MSIVIAVSHGTTELEQTLRKELPDEKIFHYGEDFNQEAVESIILWKHQPGILEEFPNLKWVSSLGAGVDHIMSDPSLRDEITITRIVDPTLVSSMRKYLLAAVLNYHKSFISYYQCKEKREWDWTIIPEQKLEIGIMGLGQLGKDIAIYLCDLGFNVYGFSRTLKNIEGVACFHGNDSLNNFLQQINCLICLLPLTPETTDILNLDLFKQMKHPSWVINVGRGGHLNENDLIQAIDNGWVAGACLDVFKHEPLPHTHAFWSYPEILITPHIASITNQYNAAIEFAKNFKRMKEGKALNHLVKRDRGY